MILNSLCCSVINQVATIITNNFTNWIRILSLALRLRNNHTPYIICTFPMWHFFAGFKYRFKLLHDGFIWKIPMYFICAYIYISNIDIIWVWEIRLYWKWYLRWRYGGWILDDNVNNHHWKGPQFCIVYNLYKQVEYKHPSTQFQYSIIWICEIGLKLNLIVNTMECVTYLDLCWINIYDAQAV